MKNLLYRNPTLRLSRPVGWTLLLTMPVLVLLMALIEGLARLPWVEAHVPTAIGSAHPQLDVKFGELDYLVRREGRIDCIFLGSSVVRVGIDPQIVADAYRAQTGEVITCYNFGVPGLQALSLADLGEILVRRYHPRLLIYGITVRDLGYSQGVPEKSPAMLSTPWIQYQLGSFNVEGWVVEHSAAFSRFLALRDWPAAYRFQNPVGNLDDPPHLGYAPFTYRAEKFVPQEYLKDFTIWPEQWAGFEQLVALGERTLLLVVEVPLPDHTLAAINGGPDHFYRIMDQVEDYTTSHGVPMWTTTRLHLIPADGWVGDTHHLHQIGAEVFSAWLGSQLGQAGSWSFKES